MAKLGLRYGMLQSCWSMRLQQITECMMERHTQVQMDVAHLVVLILVAQPLLLVLVGVPAL